MHEPYKICVLGASGVGKTTLARALARELQCAHYDSDAYYHYPTDPPYQKQRTPEDRLGLLLADLGKQPSWVLSGGACVWEPAPPDEYTLVVFLHLPHDLRLERLQQRECREHGARIEGGGDMATDHQHFMEWTAGYDDGTAEGTNTLPVHLNFLQKTQSPTLRLEASRSTAEQIAEILTRLSQER